MKQNLGRNSKLIKIHNRGLVLKKILQNCMISRKEIAEETGLTQAAITKIVNILMDQGLVVEKAIEVEYRSTGRQPIGLCLNTAFYRIASVEIGRSGITAALLDLSGNVLNRMIEDATASGLDYSTLPVKIPEMLSVLFAESRVTDNQILGIGISAPGPINKRADKKERAETGGLIEKKHEPPFDWRDLPVIESIENKFSIPVFADNSGNISALAEGWFGQGKELLNFVQYTVGLGIGAGVILDGYLYRGDDDVVSEIGHVTVDLNGPVCICGNIGCFEGYANFKNILTDYYRRAGIEARSWDTEPNETVVNEINAIWKMAVEGDETALESVRWLANYLGIGAVSITNIFSPECIILSSNDVGDLNLSIITDLIEGYIKKHAFAAVAERVSVIPSRLGRNINLLGAEALVLQELFSNENFISNSGSEL